MSGRPDLSRGSFRVPRYGGLVVTERVKFRPTITEQFNVVPVIDLIANMGEENPCVECTNILDLVRILAQKSNQEPEDMGRLEIDCTPSPDNQEFYRVVGKLADGTTQEIGLARCQLIPWMLEHYR